MSSPAVEDSAGWRLPRHELAHGLLLTGIGLALYGFFTVGYPRVIVPMICAVIGAVLVERGIQLLRTAYRNMDYGSPAEASPSNIPAFLLYHGQIHPQVQRLLNVLHHQLKDKFTPVMERFEVDGEALVSYVLRGVEPGMLGNEGFKTKLANILGGDAVPASLGAWEIEFDSENDLVLASQRQKLQKVEFPPHWPVCQSPEESRKNYSKFSYSLGVGEHGKELRFRPESIPHLGVWGTSGSGKSVMVQNLIEQFRAGGFQIMICDPKRVDYAALASERHVTAVASSIEEQIILVHLVRKILEGRKTFSEKQIRKGNNKWADELDPILLILDEFASARKDIGDLYGKTRKDRNATGFDSDIENILRQGRAFRVHCLLANQDIYADSVPGAWQNNIQVNVCMGTPHHLTVKKAFRESSWGLVTRVGSTILKGQRGRGLVAITDEDGDNASVEKFQGFFSYSPAADMSKVKDSTTLQNWDGFKRAVSDRIPWMHRRFWVVPEYPDPEKWEKSDPYTDYREEFEESGKVDLTKLSVSGLHRLKMVFLDDQTGAPILEQKKYDLRDDEYIGRGGGESEEFLV